MVEFQTCDSVLPDYLSTKKPTYSMQTATFHLYFEAFLILLATDPGWKRYCANDECYRCFKT